MAYQPAGLVTSSGTLTHLATVYYKRTALDQLTKVFRFYNVTEPDQLPMRNGKTVQWYRYGLMAANTQAATEGTVSAPQSLTTTTVSATVVEYSDFITVSRLIADTAIDPMIQNASFNLGYRGGISVDTITRAEFDSNSGAEIFPLGATVTAADLRRCVALMKGSDVLPRDGDVFTGICHPYIFFDLSSDNTAGGFIDSMKYAKPDMFISGLEGQVGGVNIIRSTNVKTGGSAAPNVEYWLYVVGKGAVGAVDLAGSGPSKITDPAKEAFSVNVIDGKPQIADPEGMIGAAVSYRYVYAAKTLDSTTFRYRMIRCDASLV